MPKVSVIIPTHNRAELLRTAISSVLSQTFTDWEIIVVDDHSIDHTQAVVESFEDERIRYFRNNGKNGPSISRNLGISIATGIYVAFLDDDDEWLPHKLHRQINLLDNCTENICGVYSKPYLVDKKTGEPLSVNCDVGTLSGNLLLQLFIKNPIHTCTLLVRKKCVDKVGAFDESMQYMEDRDLWIRLSMHWDFEYISDPLTITYYHGDDHLSRNLNGQTDGRSIFLDRYEFLLKNKRKNWGSLYVCQGAQYLQLGDLKKGRSNILKGIYIYPFNLMAFFHLIASFFGSDNYQRIRTYYNKK